MNCTPTGLRTVQDRERSSVTASSQRRRRIGVTMWSPVADWRSRAACRGMDTDMFFPERGDGAAVDAAKAVCGTCPVAADCLNEALNLPDHWGEIGIWGGTSGRQRRIMLHNERTRAA